MNFCRRPTFSLAILIAMTHFNGFLANAQHRTAIPFHGTLTLMVLTVFSFVRLLPLYLDYQKIYAKQFIATEIRICCRVFVKNNEQSINKSQNPFMNFK